MDAFIHERVCEIIQDRRAEALAYLAEVQAGLHTVPNDAAGKVFAAKEFVQKSTVGTSAIAIWYATLHYHAWRKLEGWQKINTLGVSDIVEQSDILPSSSGFRCGGHVWMFTMEENGLSCSGNSALGVFRVMVDGELVMELAVDKGFGETSEWHPTDVRALRVGSWVEAVVEMAATLELAQRRHFIDAAFAHLEAQASRIKFG